MGTLTQDQLREIAEIKLPDLNANDIDAAMRIVAGTARSMGVRVEGVEKMCIRDRFWRPPLYQLELLAYARANL